MNVCGFLQITIRLGRALKKGEYRVKVYQLLINEPEVRRERSASAVMSKTIKRVCACACASVSVFLSQPCKFLVDTVFAKGMTVRQSKEELLPQLREQCKLDLSIDR